MSQQVVLVTGATSGIGKALAEQFLGAGYIVYGGVRRLAAAPDLSAPGWHPLLLDVTDTLSMETAVNTIVTAHGAVDILINNAGFGLNGPVEELDLAEIRQEFETNVFGLVRLTQLVLPAMRAQKRGWVVNMGSIGGTFTAPGAGAYHASKYAVEAFSDALRMEVRGFGIRVILMEPTGVHTPFFTKQALTLPQTGPESPYAYLKERFLKTMTQMTEGRGYGLIEPVDVAATVVRAVTSRRPRARYRVGMSAHLYYRLRRFLSDRMWDRLMATQFPVQASR